MRPETRRLHRLRYETMDWARAVRGRYDGPLSSHENSINGDPEVWGDGE